MSTEAVYDKPLPRVDGSNKPFWDGLRANQLMLQCCLDCGRHRFPATRNCAACLSDRSEWRASSGLGTVESFCTFHKAYWPSFAGSVPYDVVQIRLDEGVQFFSNLLGAQPSIGMRVEAVFDAVTPAVTLLKFRAPSAELAK